MRGGCAYVELGQLRARTQPTATANAKIKLGGASTGPQQGQSLRRELALCKSCFASLAYHFSERALLQNSLKSIKKRHQFQGRNPTSGFWNKTDRLLPNATWILMPESVLSFKDGIRRSGGPLCNNLYEFCHIGFSSRP